MEESNRMKQHVTAVGVIQIIRSSLWIMGACGAFFGLSIALSAVDDPMGEKVLRICLYTIPLFLGVYSIMGLVSGIALLQHKNWARIITLITTGIGCLSIPFGTLIGVYSIWTLMQNDTVKLFESH